MLDRLKFKIPVMVLSREQMRSSVRLMLISFLFILTGTGIRAQEDTLKEVIITGKRNNRVSHGADNVQALNVASLERMNVLQVADAVKYFAGVTVKDYGGIGGLKTVSVRGLGANHTGVAYDGVLLNDNQSGQIDLGKIPVDGINLVSLVTGDLNLRLQTARAMASGSLLNVETARPVFKEKQFVTGRVIFKTGSFGLINPVLLLNTKLSDKLSMALNADWQKANGQYPFTIDYGGSSSNEKRTNSDVNIGRIEINTFYQPATNKAFRLKLYGFDSERGLPGAIVYYNPYSSQRLWDKNYFAHAGYSSTLNEKYSLLVNMRYAYTWLRYLDPGYLNTSGRLENKYHQDEYYGSAAMLAKLNKALNITLSTDMFINTLDANLYQFARPTRNSWLTALAAKYTRPVFSIQANLLSTIVSEKVRSGTAAADHSRLSPSLMLSVFPFATNNFRLRFFYKDIFRMPTFNDLYYTGVGNAGLRPENARQFNAGITYYAEGRKGSYITASADVYRNRVSDKIVAVPTKNLFIWTMTNVGRVGITGLDISFKAGYSPGRIGVDLETSYTYQRALDITEPGSKTYRNLIPYTPVHSGSLTAGLKLPWLSLNYNFLFSGERYSLGQNTAANYLGGYKEHGMNVIKRIVLRKTALKFVAELINIAGRQYEVVRNFPMPGRSCRFMISLEF